MADDKGQDDKILCVPHEDPNWSGLRDARRPARPAARRDRALLLDLQAARGQGGDGRRLVRARARAAGDRREPGALAGDAVLTRVVALRGGAVESEHRVAWCVAHPDGAVDGPDAELPVFARSAVKPLQALGSVRAGVRRALRARRRATWRWRARRTAARRPHVATVGRGARGLRAARGGARLRAGAAARPAGGRGRAALADPPQLLGQARLRARPLPGRGLAAGRLLPRRPPAPGRDARLRRRGLRGRAADRGGDRRLRDADVRGAAGGARARVRRAWPAAALGPAGDRCAARDARASGAGRLRGRDRHRADARRGRARGEDRRRGRARDRAAATGAGSRSRCATAALRAVAPAGVALARAVLGLEAAVPDALVAAPIVNSRGIRVGELRSA